ncbi:ROK family transcriptional regulator [Pacificibacter marinus]|uniref:N-acetylglucosamine repressor n=1 Tax=Pacificibacter marinus TaxID=658057 RepID=A0A1Y5SRW8_9RHOB|nr:ROK family transcriptional regulator [Pacificibacter marinus]SEK66578.1 Sugar kinase of the NBD/HSP70 family, may contain an N-terminal HTH domain [Pacificibacter marinus]SLN46812.1 N-acetylglucosamine repressor [Pacificibacter marinus]
MSFPLSRSAAEIVEIARRHPQVARADIAKHTVLSQQSIHRITADLVARELLIAHDPIADGRGKPSPGVSLNGRGAHATCISINTDSVIVATIDFCGAVLASATLDVDPDDPNEVVKASHAEALKQGASLDLDANRFAGVGVSMHGFRLSRDGAFMTPPPLSNWVDLPVTPLFTPIFGPHVFAENNATLGAIAESWVGHGVTTATFGYLSFNHGFGGGIVHEGNPIFGANGNAGEIGTIYSAEIELNRPRLEGLIRALQTHGNDIQEIAQLDDAVRRNLPGLSEWLEEVMPQLDLIVRSLTAILDPEKIVFGGEAPRVLQKKLLERCAPRRPDRFGRTAPAPLLVPSLVKGDPALLGAGIQVFRKRILAKET